MTIQWTAVAFFALGLGIGFATVCWFVVALAAARARRYWATFVYGNLVLADLVGAIIIAARLSNHPLPLPPGASTLILLPLIVFPPAIQLAAFRKAHQLTGHK